MVIHREQYAMDPPCNCRHRPTCNARSPPVAAEGAQQQEQQQQFRLRGNLSRFRNNGNDWLNAPLLESVHNPVHSSNGTLTRGVYSCCPLLAGLGSVMKFVAADLGHRNKRSAGGKKSCVSFIFRRACCLVDAGCCIPVATKTSS